MSKIKDVIQDLETLQYYSGLCSGRWEQNEYDRLNFVKNWNCIVEKMAKEYGIGFDSSRVNKEDEYELDEFTFELKENIRSKLEDILTC